MKLPSYQNRRVDSLGRRGLGDATARANAINRTTGSLLNTGLNVADKIRTLDETKQKEEAKDKYYAFREKRLSVKDQLVNTPAYDLDDPAQDAFLSGAQDQLNLDDGQGGTRSVVEKHEVMQSAWDIQSGRMEEDLMRGLTPFQQEYIKKLDRDESMALNRSISNQQMAATNSYVRQSVIDRVDELESQDRWGEVVGLVMDAEQLTSAERTKILDASAVRQELAVIDRGVATGGDLAGTLIEVLEDPEYAGNLTRAQRKAAVRDLQSSIIEGVAYTQSANAVRRAEATRDVVMQLSSGTMTNSRLEEYYQAGLIDWKLKAQGNQKLMAQSRARVKKEIDTTTFNEVMAGEREVPVGDPKWKKNVNSATKDMDPKDPDQREQLIYASTRGGLVPQVLAVDMQTDILYGDREEQAEAVRTYSRIHRSNPYVDMSTSNTHAKTMLRDAAAAFESNVPIDDAIAAAAQISKLDPDVRKMYEEDANKIDAGEILLERLNDDAVQYDSPFYGFDVDRPPPKTMQNQYRKMVKDNYVRSGGNMEVAQDRAYMDLTTIWGTSNIGTGGEDNVMKRYPVDKVFRGPEEELRMSVNAFSQAHGVEPDDIHFIANVATENGKPLWNVMVGPLQDTLMEKDRPGVPVLYNPYEWPTKGQVLDAREEREKAQALKTRDTLVQEIEELTNRSNLDRHPLYGDRKSDEVVKLRLQQLEQQLNEYADMEEPPEGYSDVGYDDTGAAP